MFFKPLKCRDAEKALRELGFEEQKKKSAGSHRQYKKIDHNGKMWKVTLDCHKGEVSARNVKSMAKQAGVGRKAFYDAAGVK